MGNITTRMSSNNNNEKNIMKLSQFNVLQTIGQGSFGQVQIVKQRSTKKLFALKVMNKNKLIKTNMVKHIIQERNILSKINYIFISKLFFAMQDTKNVYLIIDLMTGGDLGYQLNTSKKFNEQEVSIWIAEIACALNYLHVKHKIVHRDVKPENILLDYNGHAILNDFSIATTLPIDGSLISGFYGTKPYNPPEVFDIGSFGIDADWWALGIVMYECLYKKRPFNGNSSRQLKQQIQSNKIEFSEKISSIQCRDAIEKLLQRKIGKNRLGSIHENLNKGMFLHPFFINFTVESLESKSIHIPLFNPCLSRPVNYDESLEIQKILVDNKNNCLWQNSYRLTVRTSNNPSTLSLSYLEDHFLPFVSPELLDQQTQTAIQIYSNHK